MQYFLVGVSAVIVSQSVKYGNLYVHAMAQIACCMDYQARHSIAPTLKLFIKRQKELLRWNHFYMYVFLKKNFTLGYNVSSCYMFNYFFIYFKDYLFILSAFFEVVKPDGHGTSKTFQDPFSKWAVNYHLVNVNGDLIIDVSYHT